MKFVYLKVYRQQFFRMKQSDGETITTFVSRLKAQTTLCIHCFSGTHKVQRCIKPYSKYKIKSQVITGIRNTSHQSRILTKISALPSLNDLVERLLTLEFTSRATCHFQPIEASSPGQITPIKPAYQQKKSSRKPTPPNNRSNESHTEKCKSCGYNIHLNSRKQ